MIRAIIVDDEPLAREYLRGLLAEHDDVSVVAECEGVADTARAIADLEPDVLFLDIQLRRESGFDIIDSLSSERMPIVVFVTAFDEYAIRAFEVHALDYLLKPFGQDRIGEALSRVRAQLTGRRMEPSRMDELLATLRGASAQHYPDRLLIAEDSRARFVMLSDVEWIDAMHNHTILHSGGREHRARESISSLARRLDPWRFVRVHRSAIVNIDHVAELQPWFNGDSVLIMRSGKRIRVGRTYRAVLDRWRPGRE